MRTSLLPDGGSGQAAHPQLAALARNWLVRQRLKTLLAMNERLLDDMGLLRAEVSWALSLPLSVNPADALQRRSELQRSRRFIKRWRERPTVVDTPA